MSFDGSFSIANVLTILTAIVGLGLNFAFQKFKLDEMWERSKISEVKAAETLRAAETKHGELTRKITELELKIATECVRKAEFDKFEERIDTKLDRLNSSIQETINNLQGKISAAVRESMRDFDRESRRGS